MGRRGEPSGIAMSAASGDWIILQQGDTGLMRAAVVLHEIGHIVLGHLDRRAGTPGWEVAMLRHQYHTPEEHDAEWLATRLLVDIQGLEQTPRTFMPAAEVFE